MAKIKINGDSSGYVEIAAPNAAHNNTLELGPGTKILTDKNTHTGNIGIGTDDPGSNKLQVQGGSALYGNGGASAIWGDTSYLGALSFDGSAQPVIRAASSKALIFQVNQSTEALRITSGGQIGMGIASPTQESGTGLHIRGASGGQTRIHLTNSDTGDTATDGFYIISQGAESGGASGEVMLQQKENKALKFATNNVERLRIDSGGRLLIGTTSLIDSSTASNFQIASSSGPRLCIARNNTNVTGGNLMGALDFYGNDSDGNYEICGRMILEADGTHTTDAKPTRMAFYTTPSGSDTATERLRITNAGHVSIVGDNQKLLIGSNDDIEIYHDGNSRVRHIGAGDLLLQSNSDVYIQRASDGHQMIIAENDGPVKLYYDNTERFKTVSNGTQTTGRILLNGTNGGFDYNNIAHTLEFLVSNGTTHSELNSGAYVPGTNGGKHLGNHNKRWNYLFCNGIRFGGENSDAHTLDDYEEGTYTPTYQNFTTTGTSTLVGKYVKVGRQVTVGIKWSCTGTIAYSTSAFISLPFSMTYGQEYNGLIGMLHNSNSTSQTSGKSGVQCKLDGEGGSRFFPGNFTTTSSGESLLFGGTYIAAS